jgi:hypothetical protein
MLQRRMASLSTMLPGTFSNRDSMIFISCGVVYGSKLTRVNPIVNVCCVLGHYLLDFEFYWEAYLPDSLYLQLQQRLSVNLGG